MAGRDPLVWDAKIDTEIADYEHDATDALAGDTISTSTWTITPSGSLTKDSDTHGDAISTIWLSGGNAGTTYELEHTIVTAGGRTLVEKIHLPVVA